MRFANPASTLELLENYPGLTLKDLQAAWDYYENNQTEIDRSLFAGEQAFSLSDGRSSMACEAD